MDIDLANDSFYLTYREVLQLSPHRDYADVWGAYLMGGEL